MGFITQNKDGLGQIRLEILMGLGQESDREGEVVSWEAASSAPGRVAMNCRKAPFAAIAQDFGRQGLHIMTASMRLVHEYYGTRHITVGGADNDLRKALAIASDGGSTGDNLEPSPWHHEPV